MTLVFKHFEVSLEGELLDDDVLSWGAKNVYAPKLSRQLGMEKLVLLEIGGATT